MRLLFLPGDIVQPNDSWYKGRDVPASRPRYTVSGYSDSMLKVRNTVVTLKRASKSGKTYYDTYHQNWLELVEPVKR